MKQAMSITTLKTLALAAMLTLAACAAAMAQPGALPWPAYDEPFPSYSGGNNVPIRDIAKIDGVRDNQLVGFGLVVGLNGTGDGQGLAPQALQNLILEMGLHVDQNQLNVDNIAAVMVTANMPAFMKPGDRLDITVSSVGDADSLQGGTLVQTPIKGADGRVYAVAQGSISIGGWTAAAGGAQNTKGFPTVGRIPGGALIEREIPTELMRRNNIMINLNTPDFTVAANAQKEINRKCQSSTWARDWGYCPGVASSQKSCGNPNCTCCSAVAVDGSTIKVNAPGVNENNLVSFISDIENVEVGVTSPTRVVINEKTGTIVMGWDVKVDAVSIAHGPVSVVIEPEYNYDLLTSLEPDKVKVIEVSDSEVVYVNVETGDMIETLDELGYDVTVKEDKVAFYQVNVGDIVKALNDMGVTASDVIAILQALKASGALHAEIVTM